MTSLAELALAWMLALAPATPWAETYPDTAQAIADAVEEAPMGDARRTTAVLVAIGYRESTFRPDVMGDHGNALGLFQVSRAWIERGTSDAFLHDAREQARVALRLVRESVRACKGKPAELSLSWYAAGGAGCDRRHATSRDRMALAARLLGGR